MHRLALMVLSAAPLLPACATVPEYRPHWQPDAHRCDVPCTQFVLLPLEPVYATAELPMASPPGEFHNLAPDAMPAPLASSAEAAGPPSSWAFRSARFAPPPSRQRRPALPPDSPKAAKPQRAAK